MNEYDAHQAILDKIGTVKEDTVYLRGKVDEHGTAISDLRVHVTKLDTRQESLVWNKRAALTAILTLVAAGAVYALGWG